MSSADLGVLVQHLRRLAAGPRVGPASDPQLLEAFLSRRDEASFAELVRRHGPMVLAVCRGVLHNRHDAEDVFQATFLLLARKAASIRRREAVGGWLCAVAYRLAVRESRATARRSRRRGTAREPMAPDPLLDLTLRELHRVMLEELQRLPEKYRLPLVLCYLEGRTQTEAARQLGWAKDVIRGRLNRGRSQLRARLTRRGLALSAGLGLPALTSGRSPAALPDARVQAIAKAALASAGQSGSGLVSERVAELAAEAARGLLTPPGKIATILVLMLGIVTAGAGLWAQRRLAAQAPAAAAARPLDAPAAPAPPKANPAKPRPEAAVEVKGDTIAVSGQVLDPNDKPIAGTEIMLLGKVRAKTGADGWFRFAFTKTEADGSEASWRADPWRILHLVAASKGYGPAWRMLGSIGAKEELTLRLAKDDIPIKGRLRDLQGRPVVGAHVGVSYLQAGEDMLLEHAWAGLPKNVTTDKEGRFTLTGIGRDRTVFLQIVGPLIALQNVSASTRTAESATLEVLAGPSKPIEGTIRALDTGKPLAGVTVSARVAKDNSIVYPYSAVTDDKGHYRISGIPKGPAYELRTKAGPRLPYVPKTVRVGDSEGLKPITVDFKLRHGVPLRFRILDMETRKPLHGLVQYDLVRSNPHWGEAVGPFNTVLSPEWFEAGVPNKDLYFDMVVYPGPVVIFARAEHGGRAYLGARLDPADKAKGYYPAGKGDPINVFLSAFNAYRRIDSPPADKPVTFDLLVDPGRTLRGTLLGPDDKPVRGATAYGLAWHYTPEGGTRGRDEALSTDAFTATTLFREDPCTLSFIHQERKLIGHRVVHPDEKGPVAVRLRPWGALAGRLVDAEGKPQAGVRVCLKYPELPRPGMRPPEKQVRTGKDGRFRVEGLLPEIKHELILAGDPAKKITFSAGEKLKGLSARAGEVKELGDITVKQGKE